MRVLFFPGLLTYRDFTEIVAKADSADICGVIFNQKKKLPDWAPEKTRLPTWTFGQLGRETARYGHTEYHDYYDEVLASVFADSRSFFLIERLFSTGGSRSVFNHTIRIEKAVWNALGILAETRPDRIIANNTPHSILWYVAKVAEELGVEVLFTQTSPMLPRVWLVRGVDEQTQLPLPDSEQTSAETAREVAAEFIEGRRSSYDVAIPEAERRRAEQYRGKFFDAGIELRSILASRSPRTLVRRAYSTLKKRSILKAYERLSRNYEPPEKYVAFFLHFQPERTTLPEGYGYVQQWLAIRALADSLPEGWSLVIKEHPTTFRWVFQTATRDLHFYESIQELGNTLLAPIGMQSFDVIDKSSAVATLTGQVGVEALIRGKPVLAFGAAPYRDAKGVFPVSSLRDVRAALAAIAAGGVVPSDEEIAEYLIGVARHSYPRDKRINSSLDALTYALKYPRASPVERSTA